MNALAVAHTLARSRPDREERVWDTLAYAARYGKQPLRDLVRMTVSDLARFVESISRLVREENRPRQKGFSDGG